MNKCPFCGEEVLGEINLFRHIADDHETINLEKFLDWQNPYRMKCLVRAMDEILTERFYNS